jgi:hypothetical protein
MGKKSKLYDHGLLDTLRQQVTTPPANASNKSGESFNQVNPHTGLYNTNVNEPRVNFIAPANGEILTDGLANAGIVVGSDRPSHIASGYGGKGAQKANTIDLVVGRMSSNPKLPDDSFVPVSFSGDAARIYISQLTDVDLNFGIEPGQSGDIKGRSAIGIKADAVRVIGREGVKIVSGRSFAFKGHGSKGETNSRGGKISQTAPPIELIAGNTKTENGFLGIGPEKRILQGVAKGENVRDALKELSDIIDELWSAMFNMALMATTAFTGLAITPIPWHASTCGVATSNIAAFVMPSLWHSRVNKILWDINFTYAFGDKYVVSRNVYST